MFLYYVVSLTYLPCLTVCKALVDEVEIAVDKVDPHKKVDMGSFRLDGKGNVKQNLVSQRPHTNKTFLICSTFASP